MLEYTQPHMYDDQKIIDDFVRLSRLTIRTIVPIVKRLESADAGFEADIHTLILLVKEHGKMIDEVGEDTGVFRPVQGAARRTPLQTIEKPVQEIDKLRGKRPPPPPPPRKK
jgi:hypothetical protein